MYGVGTPTIRPMSCVTVRSASISPGRPCSASCSIDVLKEPSIRALRIISSAGTAQAVKITHPMILAVGMARPTLPEGSTAASRLPASAPLALAKNHQGTPFIAVTTAVLGPSSGPIREAISGREGALTADDEIVLRPDLGGIRTGPYVRPHNLSVADEPQTMHFQRCQRLAACHDTHRCICPGKQGRDCSADGAGAIDAKLGGRHEKSAHSTRLGDDPMFFCSFMICSLLLRSAHCLSPAADCPLYQLLRTNRQRNG